MSGLQRVDNAPDAAPRVRRAVEAGYMSVYAIDLVCVRCLQYALCFALCTNCVYPTREVVVITNENEASLPRVAGRKGVVVSSQLPVLAVDPGVLVRV